MRPLGDVPAFPPQDRVLITNVVSKEQLDALKQTMEAAHERQTGMTLRDYFAAKAMVAQSSGYMNPEDMDDLAVRSYQMADAMLKAREAK